MQVHFEGICISQTNTVRAKVYFKDPLNFVDFWGVKLFSNISCIQKVMRLLKLKLE